TGGRRCLTTCTNTFAPCPTPRRRADCGPGCWSAVASNAAGAAPCWRPPPARWPWCWQLRCGRPRCGSRPVRGRRPSNCRGRCRRRAVLAAASGTLALVLAVALWTPTVQEPARAVADDIELREQLHALDRALQAAYDRGASDAEVEPMWEARDALLAGNDVASRAHEI